MGIAYNFKCEKCGCIEYVEAENEYEKVLICKNCTEGYVVEQKKIRPQLNIPRCPICQSTNLTKITNATKVAKIAAFGIFGIGDTGKTWRCNNCGSKF